LRQFDLWVTAVANSAGFANVPSFSRPSDRRSAVTQLANRGNANGRMPLSTVVGNWLMLWTDRSPPVTAIAFAILAASPVMPVWMANIM
jgi:hypothetical protein